MALPVVIVTLPSLAIYDQIAATVGESNIRGRRINEGVRSKTMQNNAPPDS